MAPVIVGCTAHFACGSTSNQSGMASQARCIATSEACGSLTFSTMSAVPHTSSAVQEETFGPTLTVTTVESLDEAGHAAAAQ